MALNISSPQFTDPSILETLPQDNVQASQTNTTNQAVPQEQASSNNDTSPSPLADGLKKIDPNTSQNKDKTVIVDLPKGSDGKTLTPEKMDFGKYEEAFLKSAFSEVGLNNATSQEINNFQREYNTLTNNSIGLKTSLSELQNAQKQSGGDKLAVKVSDYDLKVLSAGKEQILANRQQETERINKAVESSRNYTDDAIVGLYKVQINGLINTANEATKIVNLPAIPKLEIEGEYWKDKKDVVELGTTVAAGVLTGNTGVVGTAVTALTGTAHGVELVTGKDLRTGQELSPLERSLRFVSASSSAVALSKPTIEFAGKVAKEVGSKFDDFNFPPPTLQQATANGTHISASPSALPVAKSAPGNPSITSPNIFNQAANATSGVSQLPKTSPTKTSKSTDPTELSAKTEAQRLEATDGGHSLDRHGPEVTDQALKDRITTGIAPDGKVSPTNASTRFNSYKDWVETRQTARNEIERVKNVDLSRPPQAGTPESYELLVDHGRAIDDGFVADAASKTKISDPVIPGKKIKVYSRTEEVSGITRTKTTVEWTGREWEVKQHIPWAKDWNNTTKTYSTAADVTVTNNTNK
ncbi:MAG: hypothetical protein HY819_13150 [Acidobacteria bacterium]|nr:hypothetical protein [Acidobacteriota bacterium]